MSSKIFQDVFKASSQSVMIPGILINDSSLSMIFQMYKILSQFASKIQTKCQFTERKDRKDNSYSIIHEQLPIVKMCLAKCSSKLQQPLLSSVISFISNIITQIKLVCVQLAIYRCLSNNKLTKLTNEILFLWFSVPYCASLLNFVEFCLQLVLEQLVFHCKSQR